MKTIVVATIREWNFRSFDVLKARYVDQYTFHLLTEPTSLSLEAMTQLEPEYIFFPHWSWKIPREIHENFECVLFHMTDLPFGRGGSPMQNLIERGIYETKVTALRVSEGVDDGAVYFKEPFSIAHGSAEENFISLSNIIFEKMIPRFLAHSLSPKPQDGEPVIFKRRTPEQSDLLSCHTKTQMGLYDFIRMLDAEGYPRAYIKINNMRIELSEAHISNGKLVGRFEVEEDE